MPNFIDGFYANIRQKGFMKANRFLILVEPNQQIAQKIGYPANEIKYRLAMTCNSVSLPSKSFMTHEMNVTQPSRLVPYAINSNNSSGASMEFYVLADMFEKNLFEIWQNQIIDPITRQQSFYDDYAKGSSITIVELPNLIGNLEDALESAANPGLMSGMHFTEIYPYNFTINGGSQNYSQSAEPLKVKVDFMFRETLRLNQPNPGALNDGMSLVDDNGNFVRETVKEDARSMQARAELLRNLESKYGRNDLVRATLEEAQQEFAELQRRELRNELEKTEARKAYNQQQNVPRGVDGRLLNPKVDGLPAENPNDRIAQLLRQGLTFVAQGQGFLGQLF
jgi:hypothetical protein